MWTVEEIRQYARKMIERESRGNGDQINALDRIGALCRMQPRSLRRLINGETKDIRIRDAGNILSAYQAHLSGLIEQLQSELQEVQRRAEAESFLGSVDEDIVALTAELRSAKERAKGR
jgi:hypothetical protein